MQIRGLRVCDSKFGRAFVIESTVSSGGYVLGFRIDPSERLQETFNEAPLQIFSVNPVFGAGTAWRSNQSHWTRCASGASTTISRSWATKTTTSIPPRYFAEPQKQGDRARPSARSWASQCRRCRRAHHRAAVECGLMVPCVLGYACLP